MKKLQFILILTMVFLTHVYSQISNTSTPATSQVSGSGSDLVLVSNGVAQYTIYYGAGESAIIEHAAQELAMQIKKITGEDIAVTTDPNAGSNLIVVGRNNSLTPSISDKINFDAIEHDGFRLLVDHDKLYMVGDIDRGTLYGTYYLLDHYFGLHWYDDSFEVVPSTSTLSVPSTLNDLQNPRFMYREIFADSDNGYLRQHNLLNGCSFHRSSLTYDPGIDTWSEDGPVGAHNFADICGSYTSGGQILTMSDGARATAASYFTNEISSKGDGPWYGFSQEDNGWSLDAASRSFADAHGGTPSAPILDMVTDVAERVRQTYPNAHLSTLAYQWSFPPPTGMTVPEYVMVETAPIEANFGYPYNSPENKAFDYDQWNNVAATLGIWDYITNFQNYLQPLPNIYPMCENIKYFGTQVPAMKSYFGQGSYGCQGGEFAELRRWVAARLLWNPNQDYKALIGQFCDDYYGAASQYIKQYIELMHQSFQNSGGRIAAKTPITAPYLNLTFILSADSLMQLADAAVSGDFAKHVHSVRLRVDMTILLREHMYKADAIEAGITWTSDPNRRDRFNQYSSDAGITNYREGSSITQLYSALDINRVNPPVPDVVQEGQEWYDYQDLDYTICCGANYVQDDSASDRGAIEKGGDGAWAIQIPLDLLPTEGEYDLYVYVRSSGASGDALSVGPYPDMHNRVVTATEIEGADYHAIKINGGPFVYETGRVIYVAGKSGTIYVDRLVAVRTDHSTGLKEDNLKDKSNNYALGNNYPNPFNITTTIPYFIPKASDVKIVLYDISEKAVAKLVDEKQKAGHRKICFDTSDLTNGIYFYRMQAGVFAAIKQLILLKQM